MMVLKHLLCVTALAASVHAQLYAAPDGDGETCSKSSPCTLETALMAAEAGDSVKLAGGDYVGNFVIGTEGLSLSPSGDATPTIVAANTVNENGQNVPLLIAAADVSVADLAVTLGPLEEDLGQRDLGVFVTPGGGGAALSGLKITRDGSRAGFEPAMGPGSRGVLVFVADGVVIDGCTVEGPFEDGIHLPSVNTQVLDSTVTGSTRIGIVVIQEMPDTDNSGHVIRGVTVTDFGVDGIQIQGDDTTVEDATLSTSVATAVYGVHVCAPELFDDDGDQAICVPPVSPVCAPVDTCVKTFGRCGGGGFSPGTAGRCCGEGTECRMKNEFYAQCVPTERALRETWTNTIVTCRTDKAEGVSISGVEVAPANLKQAVVAPMDTVIM